jgi:UDP-glucose 4-epimerase
LILNLGSGCGFRVREIIARKVTGREIPVVEVPRRAADAAVLIASSEKIK